VVFETSAMAPEFVAKSTAHEGQSGEASELLPFLRFGQFVDSSARTPRKCARAEIFRRYGVMVLTRVQNGSKRQLDRYSIWDSISPI
jgi:hypothetical protein